MLLIPNTLCWSSRKCNCACMLPTEVGKSFLQVKKLVTAQILLHLYSEQQRAFGISNICYCVYRHYICFYLKNIPRCFKSHFLVQFTVYTSLQFIYLFYSTILLQFWLIYLVPVIYELTTMKISEQICPEVLPSVTTSGFLCGVRKLG